MTIWLMALPLGFAAFMLVFAWASHTGRDQRWGEAATRSIGRHPVLIGVLFGVAHLVLAAIWAARGSAGMTIFFIGLAFAWGWFGWYTVKRSRK